MTNGRFPLWTVLGAVVLAALVVGSGVLSSSPPTRAQRAASIESVVRCPTCEDLSVAQSSAPTAVAVRAAVAQQIAAGRSDQQIEAYLVDRYGSSIVLDPPARGWSLLVWLLPLVGGLVALGAVARVLVRRRSPDPGAGPAEETTFSPEAVEQRRQFLAQSLADADAEYLAGDLSDKDYLALRQRDMVRLAALGSSTSASPPGAAQRAAPTAPLVDATAPSADGPSPLPGPAKRTRIRRSGWFLGGAVAAFGAAALVVALSLFVSNRQPGQSATGSFAQSAQQQIASDLAQAATDVNGGNLGPAAALYQSVLAKHPDNEVALAQLGWLEVQTGSQGKSASLIADGRSKLNRAVRLDPQDYAARLYLGAVLFTQDGNATAAVDQYRQFLADDPPASVISQAGPEIRQAYQQAGVAVPAAVAG